MVLCPAHACGRQGYINTPGLPTSLSKSARSLSLASKGMTLTATGCTPPSSALYTWQTQILAHAQMPRHVLKIMTVCTQAWQPISSISRQAGAQHGCAYVLQSKADGVVQAPCSPCRKSRRPGATGCRPRARTPAAGHPPSTSGCVQCPAIYTASWRKLLTGNCARASVRSVHCRAGEHTFEKLHAPRCRPG